MANGKPFPFLKTPKKRKVSAPVPQPAVDTAKKETPNSRLQQAQNQLGNQVVNAATNMQQQHGPENIQTLANTVQDNLRLENAGFTTETSNQEMLARMQAMQSGTSSTIPSLPPDLQARVQQNENIEEGSQTVQNGAENQEAENARAVAEEAEQQGQPIREDQGSEELANPNQTQEISPTSPLNKEDNIEEESEIAQNSVSSEETQEAPPEAPPVENLEASGAPSDVPSTSVPSVTSTSPSQVDFANPLDTTSAMATDAEQLEQIELTTEQSNSLINNFLGKSTTHATEILSNVPLVHSNIDTAVAQAKSRIDAELSAQEQRIASEFDNALTTAQTQLAALRTEITTVSGSVIAKITSASNTLQGNIENTFSNNIDAIELQKEDQLANIAELYNSLDAKYATMEENLNKFIDTLGGNQLKEYNDQAAYWDGKSQGFFKGCINHKRYKARAEAAKAVIDGYKESTINSVQDKLQETKQQQPSDVNAAVQLADTAINSLEEQRLQLQDQVTVATEQSITQIQNIQSQLLSNVDATSSQLQNSMASAKEQTLSKLRTTTAQKKNDIDKQATASKNSIETNLTNSANALQQAYLNVSDEIKTMATPDPTSLESAIQEVDTALDNQMDQLNSSVQDAISQVTSALGGATEQICTNIRNVADGVANMAQNIIGNTNETVSTLQGQLTEVTQNVETSFDQFATSTTSSAQEMAQNGLQSVTDGYTQFNNQTAEGADFNITATESSFKENISQNMRTQITEEAEKAASKVQPAWKSVAKWVLIIAIIVIATVVLGPLVGGAIASMGITGAAASVLTGIVVGAIGGGANVMVNNWATGEPLTQGLGKGMMWGALAGGVGGAVSFGVDKFVQGPWLNYAASTVTDFGLDMGFSFLKGDEITWGSAMQTLGMSIATNGFKAGISNDVGPLSRLNSVKTSIRDNTESSISNRLGRVTNTTTQTANASVETEAPARGANTPAPADDAPAPSNTRSPAPANNDDTTSPTADVSPTLSNVPNV